MSEQAQNSIILELADDYNLSIKLGKYEKIYLCSEFAKLMKEYNKAAKWLDDSKIPVEQKEPYLPIFRNLLHSMDFLYQLLKMAGLSDKDIMQIDIPF